jgi:hypothetical protein
MRVDNHGAEPLVLWFINTVTYLNESIYNQEARIKKGSIIPFLVSL